MVTFKLSCVNCSSRCSSSTNSSSRWSLPVHTDRSRRSSRQSRITCSSFSDKQVSRTGPLQDVLAVVEQADSTPAAAAQAQAAAQARTAAASASSSNNPQEPKYKVNRSELGGGLQCLIKERMLPDTLQRYAVLKWPQPNRQ